jgi:Fic family protein
MASRYRPPFEVTAAALTSCVEITRLVGRYEGLLSPKAQPKLRRKNRIRTVLGSVAIEGNSLSEDQVTALLEQKRVAGPRREILEVQNAIAAYDRARRLDPRKEKDLLAAHRILTRGLVPDAGRYRSQGVGVLQGTRVAHVAPPARQVPRLVGQLLEFLRTASDHPLVKSAVVHYELEFIHPFSDGNGRIGRLWQHVVLVQWHDIFDHLPIESVVRARQAEYYRVLGACDQAGSSSRFVEFSLSTIHTALADFLRDLRPEPATASSRLETARAALGRREFSRKDYLALFKALSTATASRDLKQGVTDRLLSTRGERALARYRFR